VTYLTQDQTQTVTGVTVVTGRRPRGPGGPKRSLKGAQEEPRKWARKWPRREEKVAVGVLDKTRESPNPRHKGIAT
jgi:hypothetical protein